MGDTITQVLIQYYFNKSISMLNTKRVEFGADGLHVTCNCFVKMAVCTRG